MYSISVISICFNNLNDLINTCKSVDSQTLQPFEHYIINGSTNQEIENWLNNITQPTYRKWLNEKDKGIGDAFNKGIELSNGDYTHLLNSGDIYANENVLQNILSHLNKNNSSWVSGKLITLRSNHIVEVGKPFDQYQLYKGMRSVSHPTWFVKKETYHKIGLYNNDYKIVMDYDMMCKLKDESYSFINEPITKFDTSGISSNNYLKALNNTIEVYEKHFGFSLKCRLWQLRLKILYYLLKTSLGRFLFVVKRKAGLVNT